MRRLHQSGFLTDWVCSHLMIYVRRRLPPGVRSCLLAGQSEASINGVAALGGAGADHRGLRPRRHVDERLDLLHAFSTYCRLNPVPAGPILRASTPARPTYDRRPTELPGLYGRSPPCRLRGLKLIVLVLRCLRRPMLRLPGYRQDPNHRVGHMLHVAFRWRRPRVRPRWHYGGYGSGSRLQHTSGVRGRQRKSGAIACHVRSRRTTHTISWERRKLKSEGARLPAYTCI